MIDWKNFTDKTWYGVFEDAVDNYPEKEAIVFKDERINYRTYKERVDGFARSLWAMGVRKDDHVAVWMTNRLEWIYTKWAAAKIGAVLIPLNTRYKAHELEYILQQSDCKALIMEERFLGKFDAMGMLKEICPEVDSSKPGEINCRKLPMLKNIACIGDTVPEGCYSLHAFLQKGEKVSEEDISVAVASDDVGTIMYTSGTTGLPKGAMLGHCSHVCCFAIATQLYELEEQHKYLGGVAPFFGNIGMFSFCLPVIAGATAVLMEGFDVEETLGLIDREKVTHTILVPTMLVMLMEHETFSKYDVSSLEVLMCGGAILQRKVTLEALEKFSGLKGLMNAYGLVESSGITSCVRLGASAEVLENTVGTALPYCTIHILDPEDNELPVGEDGEICTREVIPGCHFMKGYYKSPEQTAEAVRDGYMYSGDMGRIREDGNLQITGRIKDMILVGGFNVYPAEIEGFLIKHPAIVEASVIGIPDPRLGEVPVAFVKTKEGVAVTEEAVIAFCKDKIANVKLPRQVLFADAFPMTAQGKIQKFKLKDIAIKELDIDVDD